MKNLLLASAVLFLFFSSCSEEIDCCSIEGGEQKWELVEMTGGLTGSVSTGNDMDWQEYYLLNTNTGTFIKSRTQDGVQTSASGTFNINTSEDEHYLELTYPSENELIGNCSNNLIEVLAIESEETLKGTWQECDGPGLKYKRIQ